jgi:phage terminase large subunit-like protein
MGVAFPEDEFAADYQDATTDPRKMSKFLRYSLNVWQAADARWFQGDDWAKCGSGPLAPLEGRPCWVGVDLASNLDMTAAAFVFKEADGSYSVVWRYWVPSETVADRVREGIPYDAWIRDGWVTVTDGHRLDHEAVARDIIAFGEAHEIKAVGCDPWQAGALETLLQREGITTKDIPQRTAYLNSSCKLLEALVVEGRLRHGANPVATWNANHVCVYTDPTGMIKPDKAKSNEKIDGIAALVNALALASTDEDTGEAANLDDWKIRLL